MLRVIRGKFDTAYPAEIIAETLRIFGQGMKVAVEIVAMAADAEMIPTDKEVISITGIGKGADTAMVRRAGELASTIRHDCGGDYSEAEKEMVLD